MRVEVFFLSLGVGFAQMQPDAAEILKKVTETYKDVSQYDLESTVTFHDPISGRDLSGSVRIAFKAPDKYREEAKGAILTLNADASEPRTDESVTVYDGAKMWVYMPKPNAYRVYTVPNIPRDSRPEDADIFVGIGPYRHASEVFVPSRFVREEQITAGGGKTDCFVIEVTGHGGTTVLWVDQKTYYVVRADGAAEGYRASSVFTVTLNGQLPDDIFRFVPPAGARKLDWKAAMRVIAVTGTRGHRASVG
jgi:outer membrane lipoprotein-sorting protein